MNLTAEQRAAVERLGQDVCVVAGPGSGKTRVLVERFCWRVQNDLSPLRILAVTFTEKAATEIKQRLARDFRDRPQLRQQIERAHISTVHGFCARLLREHAIEAGIDPDFEVLEAGAAAAELEAAAEETLDALLEERPGQVRVLLEAVDFFDPVASLREAYDALRITFPGLPEASPQPGADFSTAFQSLSESLRKIFSAKPQGWSDNQLDALAGIREWSHRALALPKAPISLDHFRVLGEFECDLRRLKRNNAIYEEIKKARDALLPAARQALVGEYYAAQREVLWEAVARLARIYRQRKQGLNALDFSDLEELAIGLLRDNERLRERVRESFDEVLMDELQDTNPLQAMLIGLIRRPGRFFAVGDINQSIYGFRYADPEVFRKYRDQVQSQGWTVDHLRENHRTRADILSAVEAILTGVPGIEAHELKPVRKFAEKREPSVEIIAALGAATEEAAALEAQWVARRIGELAGTLSIPEKDTGKIRLARYSDMAVLVRNVKALPAFEQAFHDFDVPYLIARGKHFFEAQEVNDLVHWLRVLVNPRDEISLAAVLRSPLVGILDESLLRLKQFGNLGTARSRLEDAALDSGDLERLKLFWDQLGRMRAECDDIAPDQLLARTIDFADYESTLSRRGRANVKKFLGLVREWFARQPRPLIRLVEELELLRASDPDQPSAPPDDSANAVRVMTIHSAKGLEFPVVFLAALHKGVARNAPALSFSPSAGLAARWRDPISGEPVKDLAYTIFSEDLKRKESEEENRLFYVAMTRAEEHLVLSFATTEKGPKNWAEKAVAGLALPVDAAGSQPFLHECSGARVRVLCASTPPEKPAALAEESVEREEECLARPEVTDQHDATASVTSVWLFRSCPRRYYLARYLGWDQPSPEARPSAGVSFGADELDAGELGRQVHDLLASIPVQNADARALELAARFRASELARRAASADRVEHEFDFLMELGDVVLQGRIDLWFEEGGELILVDYKTDDVAAFEAAAHAESYALQLRLYALALERLTGRLPDHAFVYLLRPNVAVPTTLEPASLEAARESVRALQRAQSNLDFPLRISRHCHRCPYFRGLCPA